MDRVKKKKLPLRRNDTFKQRNVAPRTFFFVGAFWSESELANRGFGDFSGIYVKLWSKTLPF